jgi:hypothetical protein
MPMTLLCKKMRRVMAGLLCVLFAVGDAYAQPGESVIDRAEVKLFDEFANIEIHFRVPINIESHAPLTHGRLLQIRVALPEGLALDRRARVGATEWLAGAQPSAASLYDYLRFDRLSASGGNLNVKFFSDVSYSVYKSTDSRAVVISVILRDVPKAAPVKSTTTAKALPPPPPPVAPVEVKRIEPSAATLPKAKLELPDVPPMAAPPALPAALTQPVAPAPKIPQAQPDPLDALLDEARQAMVKKDYDRAIALYTKVVESAHLLDGFQRQAQEAQEFLGVAREKKGQFAHAKSVYAEYLKRWPKGEGAERVRQRLAGLLALEQGPNAARTSTAQAAPQGWQTWGSFSQYFRYADLTVKRSGDPRFTETESLTAASALVTRVDLNARLRGEDWDMRARFGGGYLYDFIECENTIGSYSMLNDAWIDMRHRENDVSARIGRQYSSTGGVSGRFTGATVGVPLGTALRLNAVGGMPVDLARNATVDDTERYFYGLNLDIGPKGSRWQYNVFALQQQVDGITDREDVGGELRFYGDGKSIFARADYDTSFAELGGAMFIGNWSVTDKTALNLSLDYRFNPLLSTRNALIGQFGFDSIDQLKTVYTEDEIRELARDRSQRSQYATLSITHQFDQDVQFYGSASQFYYEDMQASGGVPALPGTDNEYDYLAQLIVSNLWLESDTTTFGMRYYDGTTIARTAAGIDARYLVRQKFRINPRLWVERRTSQTDDSTQWVYRPALRIEYSWTPHLHIDFEVSTDISKQDIPSAGTEDIIGNYAELGYWYDF